MSAELTRYESIVRRCSNSWKLRINKYVSKEQVEEAIYILTKEYRYLSSEYKEGTDILEYKENYHPPMHYFEKFCSDEEYYEDIKRATCKRCNNTSEYFIYANKERDKSEIIGIYNHGNVDGTSCIYLCHKLCLHLCDPTIEPKSHSYVSAQGRMKIPKDVSYKDYNVDRSIPTLVLPTYLHECKDPEKIYTRVYTGLIGEDDLNEILKYTHDVNCTFQGLLWITTLLSQMKMFNIVDFSKSILFRSEATSRGRAEYNPPVLDDDIFCSGFFSFVLKKINTDDKIADVCVDLTKQLHTTLVDQMYDFFLADDYRNCPKHTITCCTMGRRANQKHYEGKFSFDVLSQNFLTVDNINGKDNGMRMYCFTVSGSGCYISNDYIYPQFTDEEMKNYVEDIIKMIKYCVKGENRNVTVEELMKI